MEDDGNACSAVAIFTRLTPFLGSQVGRYAGDTSGPFGEAQPNKTLLQTNMSHAPRDGGISSSDPHNSTGREGVVQGTEKKRRSRREVPPADEALSQPISHPVRVRILEVVNEQAMSPSDFVAAGLVPADIAKGRDFQNQLSMVAYHFRGLMKAGCVEIVDSRPVRGAVEHIYKGKAVAYFTDIQWEAVPPEQRAAISRTVYQGMVARVESAMNAKTFDSRPNRTLAWTPLQLDERGWAEMHTALAACFGEVEQIKVDARRRIEEGEAEEAMRATFAILGFESPPPR